PLHHRLDLILREAMFETGPEAIEGVRLHCVEAFVAVDLDERPAWAAEPRKRPVDRCSNQGSDWLAKAEGQSGNPSTNQIRSLPNATEPRRLRFQGVVEIHQELRPRSELLDRVAHCPFGVGNVMKHPQTIAKGLRTSL